MRPKRGRDHRLMVPPIPPLSMVHFPWTASRSSNLQFSMANWIYPLFSSEVKWSSSVVSDSATPWTVAHQAPLFMGFSRQEYWSGLPFPSPGDLPDPGIEPRSPALQADALPSEPQGNHLNLFSQPNLFFVPVARWYFPWDGVTSNGMLSHSVLRFYFSLTNQLQT